VHVPLSFVVCVNDVAVHSANLMASPCMRPGSSHQVIALGNSPSAARALNTGRERAKHEWVVCLHQDVILPEGWDRQVIQQVRLAERRFGPIGVAGVYGVGPVIAVESPGGPPAAERIGHVVDRDRVLHHDRDLPAPVATLDELVLIVPRDSPLRFDEDLGFHLYGADLCLQAADRGLAVVALEAPCRHNSRGTGLTETFFHGAPVFARKWAGRLPLATPCALFDREGRAFLLGNAEAGSGSMARPVGPALQDIFRERSPSRSGEDEGGARSTLSEPGKPIPSDRGSDATPDCHAPELGVHAMPGLTSIIVPCWNQREFTRMCIQGLFRHTRPPWELIVIDNGSTDGTGEYLAGVQDASAVLVISIRNPQNLGFPAAVNQGLKAASGDFLVLLNNDAVVTDGWLDQLVALTQASPSPPVGEGGRRPDGGASPTPHPDPLPQGGREATIGLAGPMSNYAAPPQSVGDVPYRDLDEMHDFAGSWRERHRGKWFTADKLSGFCLLMTRAVYDAIGGLDERFGLGFFDDDDLAVRARRAGFELAVAKDLFVHHFGSQTFLGNGIDASALLDENARRFAAKWGADAPRGRRVAMRAWKNPIPDSEFRIPDSGSPSARSVRPSDPESPLPVPSAARGATDNGQRTKVSLTMIVRDEEANLPRCLEAVRGVFDEIVVVDTGSTDRTAEIARSFGARVFDFVWVDDFAAARNAALARATGDYAFWLDADDVVEPHQVATLRALIESLRFDQDWAYVVRCACDPGEDGSGGETVVDHIRLFPLREGLRWTYRVHEQILPALRRAKIPVRWTDLTVRHTGYVDRALRARKLRRDEAILREELAERPEDPFILFNLGAIAIERRDWREALDFLRRSLAGSAPGDSIVRKLYALIARAHQMLGEPEAALAACAAGLALDPEDAELLFREAVVRRHAGDAAGAERCWRRILTLRRPEQFASLDQGIYGHLTRRNLAALAAERGDREEAARLWLAVLEECPGDREALARMRELDGAESVLR
jgi:glycosyltransferase involved in cell wall biosynthesis